MHRVSLKSQEQQPSASGLTGLVVGRPKKRKLQVKYIIKTGKGRGRPKKQTKIDEDIDLQTEAVERKPAPIHKVKVRGRPKKVINSDDEDDESSDSDNQDNEEERRPVGRPPTGAIKLNIVRTGRKIGRPKNKVILARRAAALADGVTKKPGRPSLGKKSYVPTGKPRGRPKLAANVKDSPIAEICHKNHEEKYACSESSIDESDKGKLNDSVASSSSKSRGRPKLIDNFSVTANEITAACTESSIEENNKGKLNNIELKYACSESSIDENDKGKLNDSVASSSSKSRGRPKLIDNVSRAANEITAACTESSIEENNKGKLNNSIKSSSNKGKLNDSVISSASKSRGLPKLIGNIPIDANEITAACAESSICENDKRKLNDSVASSSSKGKFNDSVALSSSKFRGRPKLIDNRSIDANEITDEKNETGI